jgi:hypothetical protein
MLNFKRNCVTAWLIASGTVGISALPAGAALQALGQQPPQDITITGMVKGRFEITPLSRQLKLGQPNEISVKLHADEPHSARAILKYLDDQGGSGGFEGYTELVFKYHEDGRRYFNITPPKLGKLQIIITVTFEDGRVEIEKMSDLEVVPANK